MGKKKNMEAIVQIFILITIAGFLFDAMISKKVNSYVHPRFFVGMWISIVVLILFAISLISKVKKARHNVNVRHYIIFVIPLVAALLFPATSLNSKDMNLVNSNITSSNSEQKNQDSISDEEAALMESMDSETYSEKYSTNQDVSTDITASTQETQKSDVSEKYVPYEKGGVMVISDDIFAEWYSDVYDYLNCFKGKKCKYLAQVYSMEDFNENQFLAGRYFMVCCAADLVGYGITCESDIRSELKDEEWITVEGTIDEYEYNGYMVPLLTDVTITEAEAPEDEYIYYSNY